MGYQLKLVPNFAFASLEVQEVKSDVRDDLGNLVGLELVIGCILLHLGQDRLLSDTEGFISH